MAFHEPLPLRVGQGIKYEELGVRRVIFFSHRRDAEFAEFFSCFYRRDAEVAESSFSSLHRQDAEDAEFFSSGISSASSASRR